MLALNCKGVARALIKALAAGEHEATRGVVAWYRLTRDDRASSARPTLGLGADEVSIHSVVPKCQTSPATVGCGRTVFGSTRSWSTRRRKSRRRCQTVAKFSSIAAWCPKKLEKDLLNIDPTASYKATVKPSQWWSMHCLPR